MKKILLITLIFIFQSIPSFGSPLDRKGLICKNMYSSEIVGFQFKDGKTIKCTLVNNKDVLRFEPFTPKPHNEYYTDKDTIKWYLNTTNYRYTLDRKTLKLRKDSTIDPTYRCDVYGDEDSFITELLLITEKRQIEYNESLKNNKI